MVPRYEVLGPVFFALNAGVPSLDITMANNLPSAGTVTTLFKDRLICPTAHETELLAESKLPLLSYNAPVILPPAQLAPPTSIVIA